MMRKALYRGIAGGAALAGLVLLAGCLGPKNYVERANYVLRPQPTVQKAAPTDKALGVRSLDPAESVRDEIAYRDSDYQLRYYDSASWAESPRDTVTRVLKDALVATGHFRDVGDSRDMRPDLLLTGELREVEEIRTAEGRFAVVTVRLEVRTMSDNEAVWAETLTSQVSVEGDGLSGLAAAMSKAIAEVAERATAAIVQRT